MKLRAESILWASRLPRARLLAAALLGLEEQSGWAGHRKSPGETTRRQDFPEGKVMTQNWNTSGGAEKRGPGPAGVLTGGPQKDASAPAAGPRGLRNIPHQPGKAVGVDRSSFLHHHREQAHGNGYGTE